MKISSLTSVVTVFALMVGAARAGQIPEDPAEAIRSEKLKTFRRVVEAAESGAPLADIMAACEESMPEENSTWSAPSCEDIAKGAYDFHRRRNPAPLP